MKFLGLFSVFAFALLTSAREPPAELVIETTFKPAVCEQAHVGDAIEVHYTGTLFSNGNKFDSSFDRHAPLPLTLGVGQVIKGWDEGLEGMCLKEKRTLTIPAHKAYGSRGFGSIIPANSALVFDVELVKLKGKTEPDAPKDTHEEL
ncbi:FK506-binding protein 2 [Abortiporus biennis]